MINMFEISLLPKEFYKVITIGFTIQYNFRFKIIIPV